MKVRDKETGRIMGSSQFNTSALFEVLTGDDSWYIRDLDVWLESRQEWKDMRQAFKDRDLITDNYNQYFFEPVDAAERERGYR